MYLQQQILSRLPRDDTGILREKKKIPCSILVLIGAVLMVMMRKRWRTSQVCFPICIQTQSIQGLPKVYIALGFEVSLL